MTDPDQRISELEWKSQHLGWFFITLQPFRLSWEGVLACKFYSKMMSS